MLNSAEWAPVIFLKYSCLTNVLNKKIASVRNFTAMLAFYQTTNFDYHSLLSQIISHLTGCRKYRWDMKNLHFSAISPSVLITVQDRHIVTISYINRNFCILYQIF